MSVAFLLIIILFFLMIKVGGGQGAKAFFTLFANFIFLFIAIIFIVFNAEPIFVTVICCIVISAMTIFYINGINAKTVSALLAVAIVLILTIALMYNIGVGAKIQGFGEEEAEAIGSYSLFIHNDFVKTVFCVLLFGVVGAIIDVAITISSSMNEIVIKNPAILRKDIYKSGLNIGRDIIGAMTNTLLFAYIGGFMTLIIWFKSLNYSFSTILNAKVFCSEIFQVIGSGIGIILIIPVTSFIAAILLSYSRHKE